MHTTQSIKYKYSKMIKYTKYLQTRLYKNDASSSDAISPDFLYNLPDLVVINSSCSYYAMILELSSKAIAQLNLKEIIYTS